MDDDIEELVTCVLSRRSGLRASEISHDSRLVQDLKLDGDDAVDALIEISKKSALNLEGFDASFYFNSEPSLLSFFRPDKRQRKELTVGEVIDAARSGRRFA